MKRLIIATLTATALLALSACNKEADKGIYSETEIGLRAMSSATKSAINGTAFPEGYDMLVSAYFNIGSFAAGDTPKNYFQGIHFTKTGTAWKSTTQPKYYPIDGTLDFLAIASAGLKTAANGIVPTAVWGDSGESPNVAKQVVVTVPDNSAKFDDLLYGAANAQGSSASGTGIAFQHAMTAVVFVAKCNVAYNAETNVGITLNRITIDGAKYSGTLTVSNPAAGGGSGDLTAEWSGLASPVEHQYARVWEVGNTGVRTNESTTIALNLGTEATNINTKPFGDAYVLLPAQAAVPFTIHYTQHNGFQADGTTPLNADHQYQVTPSGNWAMGKKNIYSLNFTLTEIQVTPEVTNWDNKPIDQPLPDPANGHAYVDLGLRVGGNKILFATMNVGASAPQEYGDYFAWGETSKRYTSISGNSVVDGSFGWANCPYHAGSAGDTGWSKYIPTGMESYGVVDNKLTLEAGDDVASVLWGSNWRMPDKSDLEYLISSNVTYSWTNNYNDTGVQGYIITGKEPFSSASLFLPAAGYCNGAGLYNAGVDGNYWSRSVNSLSPGSASSLYFGSGSRSMGSEPRYSGRSVRPVLVIPNE